MKDTAKFEKIYLEKNAKDHLIANPTTEQLENISYIRYVLLPVKINDNSPIGLDLGGTVVTSSDNLNIDWKKGIVTEKFSPTEPLFDDHKIILQPLLSSADILCTKSRLSTMKSSGAI